MTKIVILEGLAMTDREAAHTEIASKMAFPDRYGRNLDALYDLLTECDAYIALKNAEYMRSALGEYGKKLLQTFEDAALENPRLRFEVR